MIKEAEDDLHKDLHREYLHRNNFSPYFPSVAISQLCEQCPRLAAYLAQSDAALAISASLIFQKLF